MPELPEVQTTVDGINRYCINHVITDVWSDYDSPFYHGKKSIKDPRYFTHFQERVTGSRIIGAKRRAKLILIEIEKESKAMTIAVHMKMTGHFMYGHWEWNESEMRFEPPEGFWNKTWAISKEQVYRTLPFSDPYNNYIHLMFDLKNPGGKAVQLAFSDMRKFGSVTLFESTEELEDALAGIGPEPLEPGLSFDLFMSKLRTRPKKKVKTALLDQSLIAGFGNIYTDEVLWAVGVHPESEVGIIPDDRWREIFRQGKKILEVALQHGGDSMGDYRNIDGQGGSFQNMHKAYQKEGTACTRKGCSGVLEKKLIDQRVGRLCPAHQKLFVGK